MRRPGASQVATVVRCSPWRDPTNDVDGASLCQETCVHRLYGGCWWVREVTCPKSQRAGFQLAALDSRARVSSRARPQSGRVAQQLSVDDIGQTPVQASHRLFVALAFGSSPQVIGPARGVLPDLGKGHDVEA